MLRRFNVGRRRPSIKTFNVVNLDGSTLALNLDCRCSGKELLDRVLQEWGITSDKAYFSLAIQEENYLKWIFLHKPLKKQMSGHSPHTVFFRVYIYPSNHHSLLQSLSRHYLYLQIKQDLLQNRLQPSSPSTTNRIAALMVQGEIGNFIPQSCSNGYIKALKILPDLTSGMEEAIKQAHRLNRGRLPGECQEEVLDTVQEEPTYGSIYYNIQDSHRQPVTLCVCPVGVRVAQGGRQVNCFKWENLTKIANRGKHLHFHVDASQTLNSYQASYSCPTSQIAQTISSWCQTLVSFYCSLIQEDMTTKSRLKRFFVSRRSLRRGTNQTRRQTYIHPNSNPVQRRSRRASLGEVQRVITKEGSGSSSQASVITVPRSDSKLVIYGLSGLAQSESNQVTDHTPNSTHLAASQNQDALSTIQSPNTETVTSEEHESGRYDTEQTGTISPLHIIQGDEKFGTGNSGRGEGAESGMSLRSNSMVNTSSEHLSTRGETRQETGREAFQNKRGEYLRQASIQSSIPDVEHRSASALLQERNPSSLGSHEDMYIHSPTPPLPSMVYDETEQSGDDRRAHSTHYQRSNHKQQHRMQPSYPENSQNGIKHYSHHERSSRNYRSTPQLYTTNHHHSHHNHHHQRHYTPSPHRVSPHNSSSSHHNSQQHQTTPHRSPHYRSSPLSHVAYNTSASSGHINQISVSNSSSRHHMHRHSHHQVRREDPQFNNYNHWQESSIHQPHDGYHHQVSGGKHRDRSATPERNYSSDCRFQRHHSQGDDLLMDNVSYEYRQRRSKSPLSAGLEQKNFRYPNSHHYQAWRGGHNHDTYADDMHQQHRRGSSSLPLHANPDFSLYEEDEEMVEGGGKRDARVSSNRSRKPMQDVLPEASRHVSHHKRLRHSTITSLTSLSSDLGAGGMSRLGSIASLDHQANLAELSQADSISGYFDPHVRSMVFEASQNSQGTEL